MIGLMIGKLFGGFWRFKKTMQSKSKIVRRVSKLFYSYYISSQGSYIAPSCEFAGQPTFPHGIKSIFIAGGAKIGKNSIIYQQVTIGSNMLPDSKSLGAPIIGDNVLIGAGAKIIGNITIGNNCRIGANAVVSEDVPNNCVVVMNKPRIIQKENLVNKFYCWSENGWVYYENGKYNPVTDEKVLEKLGSH